ncbi:MAG: cytochrome P450 [Pseudomonadota bacterium]|nr:cytochrome P450 [Pseudomonadota bacterium]
MERLPEVPGGMAGAALTTWRLVHDPVALMRDLAARHGRTFRMALLDGPSVVTGDPAMIADIFGGEQDLFDAPNEIVGPLVGDGSIVLAGGARHKRKRKLLAPPFHGARMRTYGRIVAEATARHSAALVSGREVAVLGVTQRISLEVILRAVFGIRDDARVEALRVAIDRNVAGFPAWLMFLPFLHVDAGGFGPWARYRDTVRALVALLREEVERGRREAGGDRQDILAMLLAARDEDGAPMPDDEVIDELRTLVIAGHETTATTMGWALWQLHRNPSVLERLRAELATAPGEPEALARLPYLAAVCDEALRLHPIVPIFRRRLTRAATLAGHAFPAGTMLHPAVLITHFDPAIYPDPLAFRPERFLERKYSPYEFIPFGGGNRRCVGAAFASFEMQVALGTLLPAHRFRLDADTPIRLAMNGVTTRPVGGVTLRYVGR